MTKGNPAKLILRFAFPIIITNLGQQFYMITDAAIVGRGVGVEALAAIGCTDWTYWVVLWSVSAMTQGFATFIARYFGQQNYKMMNRSIAMSISLSLAIALLFTGLGIALAKPILSLLETPKAILFDAVTYLTTMLAGTVIITGYNLFSAMLRALGDGKSPLTIVVGTRGFAKKPIDILKHQLGFDRTNIFGRRLPFVLLEDAREIMDRGESDKCGDFGKRTISFSQIPLGGLNSFAIDIGNDRASTFLFEGVAQGGLICAEQKAKLLKANRYGIVFINVLTYFVELGARRWGRRTDMRVFS